MDIGKSNENFKDEKPKFFNYNKYGHMEKECWSKKKERETRKCFKCNEERHIAKNCKRNESMKKHKVQEESDDENDNKKNNDKKQGFEDDLE